MEYKVEYGQMTNAKSDYSVQDGTMHLVVDAELHNGEYMAARVPKEACDEYTDFVPLYIHRTTNPSKEFVCGLKYDKVNKIFRFVIREDIQDYDILGEDESFTIEGYDDELSNFCAIGNILCFTLHGEVKCVYYLDGTFKLFNRLPPRLSLKLTVMRRYCPQVSATSSEFVEPTNDYVNYNRIEVDSGSDGSTLTVSIDGSKVYNNTELTMTKLLQNDENVKKLEDRVFGALNSGRAQIMKKGYLMFPVMLRYAYRLYDGSTIMASQPILMYPMLPRPYLFYSAWQKFKDYNQAADGYDISGVKGLSLFFEAYRIFANVEGDDIISELKQWNGIVKSVDIFISPQMYTIESDMLDYSMFEGNGSDSSPFRPQQAKVRLKERNIKDIIDGVSAFHLVKSIDISELDRLVYNNTYDTSTIGSMRSNFNEFSRVLPDDLTNYTEKETLSDSLYDNGLMSAGLLLSYNKRLLCGGVSRLEPSDYEIGKLYPQIYNEVKKPRYSDKDKTTYYDGVRMNATPKDLITKDTCEDYSLTRSDSDGYAAYEITDNGAVTYISSKFTATALPKYLAFPGNKMTAYIRISADDNGNEVATRISLKRSDTINVSYNYPFAAQEKNNGATQKIPSVTTMGEYARIDTGNILKASEVNNPLIYKDGNSTTCGMGEILALASNALPVSTGQFGQYPIFAFCTDGVYAVQVGADGTLQSCVPYSYDILVDKHSICNVERSIVFITKQGVVSIGDARTLLLDADKRAKYAFDNDAQKTFVAKSCVAVGLALPDLTDLSMYLTTGARMAYDSVHARLIVFNPRYAYSYVYNYAERAWCIITETFARALNDSGQCKMVRVYSDGENGYTADVIDYATDDVVEAKPALLISRPLKMSASDALKTVTSVIQRGVFDKGHVAQAIYGSNDNRNWTRVKSSNGERMEAFSGSGYKYFRLVVFLSDFTQDECISGCSVDVNVRMSNKLR